MRALSIFADEAGQQDMSAGYYLLTIVEHDQERPIGDALAGYEASIRGHGLPDVPFHMVDLLHGHGDYEGMGPDARKKLLALFNIFVQRLPIAYHTFSYSSYDVAGLDDLVGRMRRDLSAFVYADLAAFQSFDRVPVYYDEGQQAPTRAIHEAFGYMLGAGVVEWRRLGYADRRLAQVADYLCSVELAALRYGRGAESATYRKFFGLRGDFKRNYLRQARRKLA